MLPYCCNRSFNLKFRAIIPRDLLPPRTRNSLTLQSFSSSFGKVFEKRFKKLTCDPAEQRSSTPLITATVIDAIEATGAEIGTADIPVKKNWKVPDKSLDKEKERKGSKNINKNTALDEEKIVRKWVPKAAIAPEIPKAEVRFPMNLTRGGHLST